MKCAARIFSTNRRGKAVPCTDEAITNRGGVALCWTHAKTIDADLASLDELVRGVRDPAGYGERPPLSESQRAQALHFPLTE